MTAPGRSPRDDDDVLARALLAVASRPPPPPPPFDERIAPALDAPVRRAVFGRSALAGIGGLAAAAALVVALTRRAPEVAPPPFVVRSGAEFVTMRDGAQASATGPATLVSLTAEIAIEAGTHLSFEPDHQRVHLQRGRATFHMLHPDGARAPSNRAFWLYAGGVLIRDLGTTFTVDVDPGPGGCDAPPSERVVLTVTEGWVEATANGVSVNLPAGRGLAFVKGMPSGEAWPLDAKPTLALESETADATTGAPVVLRVVLANPTDGWIPWPAVGGAESPLHVEVTDPAGAVTPVRVTNSMLVDGSAGAAIPPRGQSVLRVRFDRTFASPGTYRLRAIFRPAEAVEDPTSAPLSLPVRAPGSPPTTSQPTTGRPR